MLSEPIDELLIKEEREPEVFGYLEKKLNPFILKICKQHYLQGAEYEDLRQYARIGLLKAIKTYDLERGSSLISFARICIKGEILSAVKLYSGKKQKNLNTAVSLNQPKYGNEEGRTLEEILISPVFKKDADADYSNIPHAIVTALRRIGGTKLQRTVVQLYLRDFSYEEMSLAMYGRSEHIYQKKIDNALQRAFKKLRDKKDTLKRIISKEPRLWKRRMVWPNKAFAVYELRKLIEKDLKLSLEQIPEKVNYNMLVQHGFARMLWKYFNNSLYGSPYEAINAAYPEMFKPWEIGHVPNNYWKKIDNAITATKWLVEEKLKIKVEEIPKIVNNITFEEYGLDGMVNSVFTGSPYKAINAAYPEMFKPWEMKMTPINFWNNESNVIDATKWLLEEKLNYNISNLSIEEIWDQRIAQKISKSIFENNGLRGLIAKYNNTFSEIMNIVYPDKFYDWSFSKNRMWSGQTGKKLAAKAVQWLFEEKENIPLNQIPQYATHNFFINNGFRGMISSKSLGFNGSPFAAVDNAYPGMFKREQFGYKFSDSKKT